MKATFVVCIVYLFGIASCGILTSPGVVSSPSFDTSYVRSDRFGGNFAYSTVESRGYSPVVQHLAPVSYQAPVAYQVPVSYAVPQRLYSQSYVHQPLLAPSLVSSPIYSGVYGHGPLIAQTPSFVAQSPIFGSYPVQGQAPGQFPVAGPAAPPQSTPQEDAPQGSAPASGPVDDNDTVSVESA